MRDILISSAYMRNIACIHNIIIKITGKINSERVYIVLHTFARSKYVRKSGRS